MIKKYIHTYIHTYKDANNMQWYSQEVADPGLKKVDVLHKKYDKSNKRHRSGYDEALGMTLR